MTSLPSKIRVMLFLVLVLAAFGLSACGARKPGSAPTVAKTPAAPSPVAMAGDELRMPNGPSRSAPLTASPSALPAMGQGRRSGELASAWSAAGDEGRAPAAAEEPRLRSLMEGDDWMSAPTGTSGSGDGAAASDPEMTSSLAPPRIELPAGLGSEEDDAPSYGDEPEASPAPPSSASPWDVAPTLSDREVSSGTPDLMAPSSASMERIGVDTGAAQAIDVDEGSDGSLLPEGDRKGVKHKVRQWENLWGLARKYGVSSKAIVAYNRLSDPNHIWVGQTLYIPTADEAASVQPSRPPSPPAMTMVAPASAGVEGQDYHLVLRGESLSAIARKYGCSMRKLSELNELVDPSRIFAGMRIKLPAKEAASQTLPETPRSAMPSSSYGGGSFGSSSYGPVGGMPDVMTP